MPTAARGQPSPAGSAVPIITSIAPLAEGKQAWLTDIWGVMHNGVAPFRPACEACLRFRASGGTVVLLSNAPRPGASVAEQLERIGVPRDAWDLIVSSGDAARAFIVGLGGGPILHVGPTRDLAIYEHLGVRFASPEEATAVVCTGLLDDETETPEDYAGLLATLAARSLPMVCANPDITVERGSKLVYCAGALAAAYEALGGQVQYAGKPHKPVYDLAFERIAGVRGHDIDPSDVLAIGDGIRTDVKGAVGAGVPVVFVASGVHVAGGMLDAAALDVLFREPSLRPIAAMTALRW